VTDVLYTDAKQRPEALGADVMGVGKATTGSLTDKLTREHRLTLDEAHLILNTKKEDSLEQVVAVSANFPSQPRVC
jgi:import inner membrane translocase subunit TIM16